MGVVLPQPIQFGKYTLFERIGRGGMADVFKARVQGPAGFERVFVVKRILPHLSDDPQFNKMFVEEAKMSARLNHANIVQVFELGSVDGEYFISMEYVRGRDLAETMRTLWARVGPPRPELVAYIGREMCRALDYAHHLVGDDGKAVGMIHRDVSPSNVMLSYEGAVKLLDFGIAKALGGDQKEEGNTQRGTLKGKFAYMAPEQTQGNDVDRRIDVFATGIVLHEMLTGRRLFKGENDLQTVEKVRQCDVPPPSLQNPLCPPELDAIVLRALARNKDERFQTAGDMADALDDIVHATRFQPTHLAQLMRDLFPGEAGDTRNTTGSVRVSQTMTGSASRPYSSPMRSPTVPPVTLTRSGSNSTAQLSPPIAMQAPEAPKPFYQKPWVLLLALLLGGAATYGAVSLSTPEPRVATTTEGPRQKPKSVKTFIDSLPIGAEVTVKGTNGKVLCTTPCNVDIELRQDGPTILVFKKKDYQITEKELRPGLPLSAKLDPDYPTNKKYERKPDKDEKPLEGEVKPGTAPTEPPPMPIPTGTSSPPVPGSDGKPPKAADDPFAPGASAPARPGFQRRRPPAERKTPPSDIVNPF